MFHIIYKTTNKLDGKFYIGAHSTSDLDDGYLGSGKYLRRAIRLYGRENFTREVLYTYKTKEEMFAKEAELVTEDFIAMNNTYNLKRGGSGGNPGIVGAFSGRSHSEGSKEKIRRAALNQKVSDKTRAKMSQNNSLKNNPETRKKLSESLTGRTCSEEHRKNVAKANIGKVLVNNGMIAKRVHEDDLPKYINEGWSKGRLKKHTSVV